MTDSENSNCQFYKDRFIDFIEETLGSSEWEAMQAHLQDCADCRISVAEMRAVFCGLDVADRIDFPVSQDLTSRAFARVLLEAGQEDATVSPALTQRTYAAVATLARPLRKIVPLQWQLLRSALAACILATFATWLFIPALGYTEMVYDIDICASNLKSMGRLIKSYPVLSAGNENPLQQIEGALNAIYMKEQQGVLRGAVHQRDLCACPSSKYSISYDSAPLTDRELHSSMPGALPIVWDRRPNHQGGRNVLFLSGRVEFLDENSFLKMQLLLFKMRNRE